MKAGNFLCIFLLLLSTEHAYTLNTVEIEDPLAQARGYLWEQINLLYPQEEINIHSTALNSRLFLSPCDKPLTLSHQRNAKLIGHVSIKVTCNGSKPWAIYTKHRVDMIKTVVTSKRSLPRAHLLAHNDLQLSKRNITQLHAGFISDKDFAIGKVLRRPISEGQIIFNHQLKKALAIKKGNKVNIQARHSRLVIMTTGIALDNGQLGEQIDIKNTHSSRVIKATVTGVNQVSIDL